MNDTQPTKRERLERRRAAHHRALASLLQLLALFGGSLPAGLYINGDPRGHMLKLDCGSAGSPGVPIPDGMERDWGGDGILAADIT